MENRNWIVYKHVSPSGGVYIGITHQKPEERWNHGKGYKRHPYFFNAIIKYGWDSFQHEILFTDLSKEEANEKEKELIKLYRSGGKCYNINDGGEFTNDTSKRVYQYDRFTGEFIKEWHGAAECARYFNVVPSLITNCCNPKCRTKTACNYIFSYEKHNLITPVISTLEKPVDQYSESGKLIKHWRTRKEAESFYNITLKEVLSKRHKKANGYIWKYSEDTSPVKPFTYSGKKITINNVEYDSLSQASRLLNISIYKLRKNYESR